jgi:hypothetical protein
MFGSDRIGSSGISIGLGQKLIHLDIRLGLDRGMCQRPYRLLPQLRGGVSVVSNSFLVPASSILDYLPFSCHHDLM